MLLCKRGTKAWKLSLVTVIHTNAWLADVNISIAFTGKLSSKTMVSSNKTHSTNVTIDVKIEMSTSTILIVPPVTSTIKLVS